MSEKLFDPRFIVTLLLIGLFGWALGVNPADDTMKGALIAGFAGAWGFWLGSSRGAATQTDNLGKALDLATAATPPEKPDVTLQPGETAQAATVPAGEAP